MDIVIKVNSKLIISNVIQITNVFIMSYYCTRFARSQHMAETKDRPGDVLPGVGVDLPNVFLVNICFCLVIHNHSCRSS